jgi:EF hand
MRLTCLAIALLTATMAAAQPAPAPAPAAGSPADAQARLLAADANKDGKWDKPEWLAAGRRAQGFAFLDTDKDGFVSREELKAGIARMRQSGLIPN